MQTEIYRQTLRCGSFCLKRLAPWRILSKSPNWLAAAVVATLVGQTDGHEARKASDSHERSETLSLSEVVASVLENNPMIQSSQAKWRASVQRVPQAAAWEDPKLGFSTVFGRFVSVAPNSFTDQSVGIEQMIPVSGKNRSKGRAAAAEAMESFEEARRQQLDVVAKAKSSYYQLASLYQLLDLNKADEQSLLQSRDATQAKFEVGSQTQADLLLADNERQKVIEARRDLEQQISNEQSNLNVLMNRDPFAPLGRPGALPENSTMPSPESLRQVLLTNRPEIRGAQAMLTSAKAKLELAKREWIPDPTVSFEGQRYNDASQAVSQVGGGVSISLPWLNGKKYRAEEEEARSGVDAAESELISAQTEALGLLRNQLQKIETLHHHIELYRGNLLPTARQTVTSYQADYETDKTTLLMLLSAQRSLFDLETMYAQHLADYQTALAELDALVGSDQNVSGRGQSNLSRKTK
jgi:cobalt-zinc-cadmium efflux system outer membrane protein